MKLGQTRSRPVAAALLTPMLFVGGVTLSAPVTAQIEEIVVTATRREESVQDVPIAIAAFSGTDIEQLALGDLRELTAYIPGVELFDDRGASSQPTWVIRGVGLADFNANNTPTAAIYYDDFYLTSNVMGGIGLFDMERVEVLKGAQGGLYGRNTTGGAVRVQSMRPTFDGYNGYVKGSYGKWDRYGLEGAFGGQLGETVAFRLAGMTDQDGGYQDSLATAGDDEWGDRDFWALRGQLLFQPNDQLSVLAKFDVGKDKSENPLGHGLGTYDPETGDFCDAIRAGSQDDQNCIHWNNLTNLIVGDPIGPTPADQSGDGERVLANPINKLDNDWESYSLLIDYDLGFATLHSITGYIDFTNDQTFDYDGGFQNSGHEINHSPIESWSQEFRLISNDNGSALSWLAGLVYAEDELNEDRTFTFPDNVLIFGGLPGGSRDYDQETESWALYGQLGYQLAETWKVHGSLRYTEEEKDLKDADTVFSDGTVIIEDVNKDYELDENWSGHVGVDWTPTDQALVYAKATRGYKSGGFFGGFGLSEEELDPYKEETVWSYEVGLKSDWLDSTLRINAAAYVYDYSDVQGFTQVFSEITGTSVTKLDNVGDADHQGVELDATWLPVDGLMLHAGVAYLDAELDSSRTFINQDLEEISFDGLKRAYAPEWSYFLQGRYERTMFGNLLGSVQLNYSWRDDQLTHENTGSLVDAGLQLIEDYGVLSGRIQLGADDGRWWVALVGKNLTDEEYVVNSTFDNLGSYLHTYGRPYHWAIEVAYHP